MSKDDIDFGAGESTNIEKEDTTEEVGMKDFEGGNYLNNPAVGEELVLNVTRIVRNKSTSAVNKSTGKAFDIGLKDKHDRIKRYDVETPEGIYTISNWEIYFKLLKDDGTGLLMEYAKAHNGTFAGAKVSIKRLIDGSHSNYKIDDLSKILGKPVAEAQTYQDSVKLAIKEQRLFEVKMVTDEPAKKEEEK